MRRAAWLVALLALLAGPAMAQERLVDAVRVFPMLDKFYATPPSDRSLLAVRYILTHDGKPATDVHFTLVVNGRRIPMALAPDGQVERPPSAADLAAHAQLAIEAPPSLRISSRLALDTAIKPSPDIAAEPCQRAIDQANNTIRRAAGLLAVAAPKVKAVTFVGAGSGVAVLADGRTVPLPLIKGAPAYDPEAIGDARTIRLAKAPSLVSLE